MERARAPLERRCAHQLSRSAGAHSHGKRPLSARKRRTTRAPESMLGNARFRAQLLGPPAVQHRLEHLRCRIDEPDTVHHVQMGRAAYFDLSLHAIPLSQLMIDSINRCEQRCGYPGQAATHQPS